MFYKKLIIILGASLLLWGCDDEKSVICNAPYYTSGNFEVVNRQCIQFGADNTVGILELKDKVTQKHYLYTMNLIDGHIILNLNSSQMLAIAKANDAQETAIVGATVAMSVASAGAGK